MTLSVGCRNSSQLPMVSEKEESKMLALAGWWNQLTAGKRIHLELSLTQSWWPADNTSERLAWPSDNFQFSSVQKHSIHPTWGNVIVPHSLRKKSEQSARISVTGDWTKSLWPDRELRAQSFHSTFHLSDCLSPLSVCLSPPLSAYPYRFHPAPHTTTHHTHPPTDPDLPPPPL